MTTGRGRAIAALVALIGLITMPTALAGAGSGQSVYYLSLGDSLSKGVQPVGGVNAPTDVGYANELFATLQGSHPGLVLHQLGCEVNETTRTMLRGKSACAYKHGTQLAEALAFLNKNRGSIALVTIDIGANDIEICANGLDIDDECIKNAFIQVATHLPPILAALRLAAGQKVPIVGMNYYNPILSAWLALGPDAPDGNPGQLVAQESAEKLASFNALLGAIYRFFGMPVADVAAAFHSADFLPLVPLPGFGEAPLNVATLCGFTHMCTQVNIHPNVDGYKVIADAFREVLP